jgi:MFS family permease
MFLLLGGKPDSKADLVAKSDIIHKICGSFGKYQLLLCLLIFLSKFPVAFHQMAIIFLAPRVHYTCGDSTVPNQCPCDTPKYDRSIFTETIVTKWNLICKDKWMLFLSQTLFQFGTLLGSIIFGIFSDRYV